MDKTTSGKMQTLQASLRLLADLRDQLERTAHIGKYFLNYLNVIRKKYSKYIFHGSSFRAPNLAIFYLGISSLHHLAIHANPIRYLHDESTGIL